MGKILDLYLHHTPKLQCPGAQEVGMKVGRVWVGYWGGEWLAGGGGERSPRSKYMPILNSLRFIILENSGQIHIL